MAPRVVIDAMISENPFSAMQYLEGVADYGRRFGGFRIAACLAGGPSQVLQKLKRSHATAILARAETADIARQICEFGKPTVNLDCAALASLLPTVCCDDVAVGRIAAEHLLDRGYTQLAYFGPWYSVSESSEEGFCKAAQIQHAKDVYRFRDFQIKPVDWGHIHDHELIKRWLVRLPRPLGLMTFNDQFAVDALEVCEMLGLRVPDDVAIVGVDNTPLRCEFATTTLSSVDLGGSRIGYAAAEMLHNLINGVQPVQRLLELQPHGVVARRSTDAMAFDDNDVRLAMRYIREQLSDGIGVEEVIGHVNISRSSLERKFKRALGRSPGDEIHRLRIHEACRLLESTQMHLADIAAACGFNYLSNFSASFKNTMKQAPSDYRRTRVGRRMLPEGNIS